LIAAFVLLFCGFAQAQEFEGAWKLAMRKLPNGTTLMPPAVQGAIIGQAGLWTRVVFWHTPEGKPASTEGGSNGNLNETRPPSRVTGVLLVWEVWL
jgi:hypothetical protein